MTRINVVPVGELCDQHLLAEFRELTRIPNGIVSGKLKIYYEDRPRDYALGPGHVKFFTDKLKFLYKRYVALFYEARNQRGFRVEFIWPDTPEDLLKDSFKDYSATWSAITLNRRRIIERMPKTPRWTNRPVPEYARPFLKS